MKINFKEVFKALSKGIGDAVTLKWGHVVADFIDLATAFELKTDAEKLVFQLINRSLLNALSGLLEQKVGKELAKAQIEFDNFFYTLGDTLADNDVVIAEVPGARTRIFCRRGIHE
ncbi:hypothetical protein MBAV_003892, partial [Candidatus Magnetobacterium bavaricum]